MTLGDGKRKVLMLLDEYSAGGQRTADADIDKKMNDFFDMAQKDMAQHQKIVHSCEVVPDGSGRWCELPKDCVKVCRIWKDGRPVMRPIIGGKLVPERADTGALTVEYYARPATIREDTGDGYEFEVSEEAANCLPYFVAAQHLMPDLVVDYSAFLNMYFQMKAALDVSMPEANSGGIRQSLFRGR